MKKKMLGAVALSTALAIGTAMPAFAETTKYDQNYADGSVKYGVEDNYQKVNKDDVAKDADGDGKMDGVATINDQEENASSTPVYISTNIAQLNVAVPTKLVFVAESVGGQMLAPSTDIYSIQNYTTKAAVYVTDIKAEYANKDANDWILVNDVSQVGEGFEAPTAKRANLLVKMTSGMDANAKNAEFIVMADGSNLLKVSTASTDALKIAKATENGGVISPRSLNFNFDAKSSVVKDAKSANGTELQAFNILYTIGTSATSAASTTPETPDPTPAG